MEAKTNVRSMLIVEMMMMMMMMMISVYLHIRIVSCVAHQCDIIKIVLFDDYDGYIAIMMMMMMMMRMLVISIQTLF